MVSVSPAFQAAATADERRVVGYLYKGNEKLYGGDVIQSMKITELCGGGEDLVPGVCACSEAEAVLLNLDGALDGVFQTGQELIPHLGFLTENGEETVPMGAVSYTHLDVYKRQASRRPASGSRSPSWKPCSAPPPCPWQTAPD